MKRSNLEAKTVPVSLELRHDGLTVRKVFALNLRAGTADVRLENETGGTECRRVSVHEVKGFRGRCSRASWDVVMDELERRAGIVF